MGGVFEGGEVAEGESHEMKDVCSSVEMELTMSIIPLQSVGHIEEEGPCEDDLAICIEVL